MGSYRVRAECDVTLSLILDSSAATAEVTRIA